MTINALRTSQKTYLMRISEVTQKKKESSGAIERKKAQKRQFEKNFWRFLADRRETPTCQLGLRKGRIKLAECPAADKIWL